MELPAKEKMLPIVKGFFSAFYGIYILTVLLGQFINSNKIDVTKAFFLTELTKEKTVVAIFVTIAHLLIIGILYFVWKANTLSDLFSFQMKLLIGSFAFLMGFSMILLGSLKHVLLSMGIDFLTIATLLLGITIITLAFLNKKQLIQEEYSSIGYAIIFLLYAIALFATKPIFSTTTSVKMDPMFGVNGFTYISSNFQYMFAISPLIQSRIVGGIFWVIFSLYLTLVVLESFGYLKMDVTIKKAIKTLLVILYAIDIFLVGISIIHFSHTSGFLIIFLSIDGLVGILAAISLLAVTVITIIDYFQKRKSAEGETIAFSGETEKSAEEDVDEENYSSTA